MGRERDRMESPDAVCWQCQARLRQDQLICGRCGATRPTAQMRAIAAKASSVEQTIGGWREDTRTRTAVYVPGGVYPDNETVLSLPSTTEPVVGASIAPSAADMVALGDSAREATAPPAEPSPLDRRLYALGWSFFRGTVEVWRATGFALLGAVVGGGLWLVVALTLHYEAGFLAVVLGACVGEGVAIGATVRRPHFTLYALGLLIFFWAICIRALASHDLDWSPLDAAYLFFAVVACTLPVRRLPARSFQRRVKAQHGLM